MQKQILTRCAPEEQGVSSAGINAFLDAIEQAGLELHSFMLLRHGCVLAEGWWEPYRAELPHVLFSLSKSFASTAAGLAIAEGKLSLDDRVLSFFPGEAPAEPFDNLKAMRVRDLLTMTTGHDEDSTQPMRELGGDNWVRGFLQVPVAHAPGTHFVYNSGATYMVSAIVEKVTGQGLLAYLTPRLLEPLGITGATWDVCPRGIAIGGWGMKVKTEDIARFGQLYLQKGRWNGVQLLPEAWVEQATSAQVPNGDNPESDWSQGYGFQFWRCRHNAYRGDGAFGQYGIVLPEWNAVIAITSGLQSMGKVLNAVWHDLLPAFGSASLPIDSAAAEMLSQRLARLQVAAPRGAVSSPAAEQIAGATYRLESNDLGYDAIRFEFGENQCVVHLTNSHGGHRLPCGLNGIWLRSEQNLYGALPDAMAFTGAWTDETTFAFRMAYVETPFCPTITCRFEGDAIRLQYVQNCGFRTEPYAEVLGSRA